MPACPNPTALTQSRIHTSSYVVVAFIASITVGVTCNCWPPSPTSSPRPILDRTPTLPRTSSVLGQVATTRPRTQRIRSTVSRCTYRESIGQNGQGGK